MAEIGKEGVLCLLSDSTNSEVPDFTMSERRVGESIDDIFRKVEGRVIFATFASNIHRLQQVTEAAVSKRTKSCRIWSKYGSSHYNWLELGYIQCAKRYIY